MRRLSEYIHIYATWPWIHPYAFKYAISTLVCFPERGFRPVTNFMRNLSALSSWYSVYTSAIAFIVSPRQPFRYSTIKLVIGTFSCYQLIGVVCGSITGLHVCSLEWLDHPYVPVPRAPPSLLELPHCQVIIPSLIVQSHWSSTLSELLLNHQPWHSHKHLLGSHWRLPVCVPMIHRSQGLEDSVEHRTWSLWARGEDLNLWSWGAQAGAKFKDSCWCLGLWRIQEPPKEDLTVSEKFQLVLDVAQRAQVRHGGQAEVYWQCLFDIWPRLHHSCFQFPPTESVWEAGKHPGENQEVSLSAHAYIPRMLAVMPVEFRLFVWTVCSCGFSLSWLKSCMWDCWWPLSPPACCHTNCWASS